jgi:hypothetical protein
MAINGNSQSTHTRLGILIAACVLFGSLATAQDAGPVGGGTAGASAPGGAARSAPRTRFGVELDVLPYATGGYYGSFWVGHDRLRVRPVIARTTLPDFMVDDGFENADIDAYALIVDYFFHEGFEGFWVGGGVEHWQNSIENATSGGKATWSNTIATVGGGYVWRLKGGFYINPWAAGHLVVGGPTQVPVGDAVYQPSRFSPEVSVKLGWVF